jgi:hypothetical protein
MGKTYFDPCESPYNGGCLEPAQPGDTLCKDCRKWETEHQAKQEQYSQEAFERMFWEDMLKEQKYA